VTKFFPLFFLLVIKVIAVNAQTGTDSDTVRIGQPIKVLAVKPDSDLFRPLKRPFIRKDSPFKKRDSLSRRMTLKRDSLNRDTVSGSNNTGLLKTDSNENARAKLSDNMLQQLLNSENLPSGRTRMRKMLASDPGFRFYGKWQSFEMELHRSDSRDGLFYLIMGLLFYFGAIRLFFSKYLNNLLALFFRASMRQQQIREQALQSPLPSLLLNWLFILSGGLYACMLFRYYHFAPNTGFWLLLFYCTLALLVIYLSKFLIFKICGWVFNLEKAADNYIFVVFLTNKILGIGLVFLLPILTFSSPVAVEVAITLSQGMLVVLLLYRFIACFGTIRAEIKLTVVHYFIYLCAFELTPLLLIYKVVLAFLEKAY
jgi:hypothetical protein